MAPGNKNGWSTEDTGWVGQQRGIRRAGQRYTLAILNSLDGEGGYDDGRETFTRLAEILLASG
ncbi:hypothetical protein JDV09_07920 [Mycobacterium sp. Y57]|uniref:hypothetical protein n=1 Tax=Mycolicibacterium xanthum TaxID=2796469 RepID=UPI001C85BAEF|nr:hypothetical protein [Mycolicibacterium xanthum]MBX7432034.1 hypothetical protein [Mycolicibacterium xanthum]